MDAREFDFSDEAPAEKLAHPSWETMMNTERRCAMMNGWDFMWATQAEATQWVKDNVAKKENPGQPDRGKPT